MSDEPKKTPERSDIIIRKAIHRALFTRKEPHKPVDSPNSPKEVNPMQKRFGSPDKQLPPEIPVILPEADIQKAVISEELFEDKDPVLDILDLSHGVTSEDNLDPEFSALISSNKNEMKPPRTEPLPQVKMVPKRSFWAMLKAKFLPVTSKVSRKQKELKTGLTNRQKIKRYNSIYEGGHNSSHPKIPENESD